MGFVDRDGNGIDKKKREIHRGFIDCVSLRHSLCGYWFGWLDETEKEAATVGHPVDEEDEEEEI